MIYEIDGILSKIKFTREASAVSRCHTIAHHGEYPVGLHTFNMLATLRLMWPVAPLVLVWAILEHDIPERLTGDIPSPPKDHGVVGKDHLNNLEIMINTAVFGCHNLSSLNPEETTWFKGLDILELYMWCKDQEMLGNKNIRVMMARIDKFFKFNSHKVAKEIVDVYHLCYHDTWDMCHDLGD